MIEAIVSQTIMAQTTVQTISFSAPPVTGAFVLNWTPYQTTYSTTSLAYTTSASQLQTALQLLTGLGSVTVTGSIATFFTVTFTGVPPVAPLLTVTSNTLGVTVTVAETDVQFPTAAQNAFNVVPTVQTLTFSGVPASGTFIINYAGSSTSAISWNASLSSIQTAVQTLVSVNPVTVSGGLNLGYITITFSNAPTTALFSTSSNSLQTAGSVAITIALTTNQAVGNQLNIIGEYVGANRTIPTPTGTITLSDSDFWVLINFAIARNIAGSSLSQIQTIYNTFFPGEILVFDYANMQMSYLISSSIGSQNLAIALVAQGFLLAPMGVQLATTTYAPVITTFFGFRTYLLAGYNNSPFNSYSSYSLTRPWLTYTDAIVI